MAGNIDADPGGILAPTLDQDAGMICHTRFGSFGLGVAKQQQTAHGARMALFGDDGAKPSISNLRQSSMHARRPGAPQ
jgi:hypothetical protein